MKFNRINFRKIATIPLILLFFIYLFLGYENKIFSFNFVDEEDNLAISKFLLSGEKLYSDIYTNHQPITYIMSAAIQKLAGPNSIPMLIKRHREFVLVWSFFWAIFLIWRFNIFMFVAVIAYELTKHYFIGNIFLAESLVVYPCIYLMALVYIKEKNLSKIEGVLIGIILGFLIFSLLPSWPFVFLIILILFIKKLINKSNILALALGLVAVFGIAAYFSSMENFLRDTIYANFKYYIPSRGNAVAEFNFGGIFSPLYYLFSPLFNSSHLILIKIFSFILVINIFILSFIRKKFYFLVILLLLASANIRSKEIESMSFHLLPWYGLLIFSACYTSYQLLKNSKKILFKTYSGVMIFVIIIISFWYTRDYFNHRVNKDADAYVNFSTPFDYGEAVRIMKNDGDRMFTIYNGSLIFWQSGIDHAVPAVFYYPWMQKVPFIREQIDNLLINNPPEFLYYQYISEINVYQYIAKYKKIKKDNNPTYLYILNKKYDSLTKEQYDGLNYYRFTFE